jgi:hypothetical protein
MGIAHGGGYWMNNQIMRDFSASDPRSMKAMLNGVHNWRVGLFRMFRAQQWILGRRMDEHELAEEFAKALAGSWPVKMLIGLVLVHMLAIAGLVACILVLRNQGL